LSKLDPPNIGAFFKVGPLAARAMFFFELEAQGLGIMVGYQLQ
jgi:hypothetical protein